MYVCILLPLKSPRKKVMCNTGWVSTYYSVHQHGEGELIERNNRNAIT